MLLPHFTPLIRFLWDEHCFYAHYRETMAKYEIELNRPLPPEIERAFELYLSEPDEGKSLVNH